MRKVEPVPDGVTSPADAPVSILLFPAETGPTNLDELLAASPLAFLEPKPYLVTVPATIARTEAQANEWGKLWPVTVVHIREGPKALPRAKGWERVKKAWIKREGERVWKAAHDAAARGEVRLALALSRVSG